MNDRLDRILSTLGDIKEDIGQLRGELNGMAISVAHHHGRMADLEKKVAHGEGFLHAGRLFSTALGAVVGSLATFFYR